MTEILNKALADFAARRNQTIDVPEWGSTVHFSALGLLERTKALTGPNTASDLAFRQAKVVAEHAKNAAGKPLFGEPTPELIEKLQRDVDPAILNRIALRIVGVPSLGEAEKN